MNRISTLAVVVLSMVLGAAAVGGISWERGGSSSTKNAAAAPTTTSSQNASQNATSQLAPTDDFTALYDQVRPSIVRITTGQQQDDPFQNGREGLGSGIVLDTSGHILTNYHVVTGFNTVTITFSDGTVAQADVVGKDPGNDIAVVKSDAASSELHPATLGDSSAVKVGSVVAAIGNPFGLDGSFTTGVISGLDRTLPSSSNGRPLRGLLQTDAAVNPGNSGGALLNTKGEIIGINTAIENPGGNSFAGVAYAIPINTPKHFLTQLTSGGAITHARLGISGTTLTASEAQKLGVSQGVVVVLVESGSSADKAGPKSSSNGTGDVITAIDGHSMKTFENLADYIDGKSVGDQVKLTVHRDGKDIELSATLMAWDSSA
ncbi:MAG: trypsin-like peptidase domain-containing protein [Chloroflexota bacterium]|nr:trypsin-like peptidase domain-containing protein [Chloroflexota bacterium]